MAASSKPAWLTYYSDANTDCSFLSYLIRSSRLAECRVINTELSQCMGELVSRVFCASAGPLKSGAKPQPQVYSSLLSSGCQAGEHAACFAELRRNFINSRPPKLKSLMLLVKQWYRQVSTLPFPFARKPPPSQSSPPSA